MSLYSISRSGRKSPSPAGMLLEAALSFFNLAVPEFDLFFFDAEEPLVVFLFVALIFSHRVVATSVPRISEDSSILHHEIDFRSSSNVFDRITWYGDDVGKLTGSEHAEVITAEEFSRGASRRFQSPNRS